MYVAHSTEKQGCIPSIRFIGTKVGCLTAVYNIQVREGPTRLLGMGGEACWPGSKGW